MSETFQQYPQVRATGCPFDPPPALLDDGHVRRVKAWDGSTPVLITGWKAYREAAASSHVSSDPGTPGYAHRTPGTQARGKSLRAFMFMDSPEHGVHRRMVARHFTTSRVEELQPRVQEIIDDLLDQFVESPKPADLVREFALPIPSRVICEILGVPYADHEFFQTLSAPMVDVNATPEGQAAAIGALKEYLGSLTSAKGESPDDDLLSRLALEQVKTGNLTLDEAADIAVLLLVAGHETTANMIALGTLVLLMHPQQLDALRDSPDPALVASAVEELLRYLSIVHNGQRRAAICDFEIEGHRIREGEGIILSSDAANRDGEAFAGDPNVFDINRRAGHHVAFGFGRHQCLGQTLARMELQLALTSLIRRIPTLRLAVPFEELRFKSDMAVYGLYSLPVTT